MTNQQENRLFNNQDRTIGVEIEFYCPIEFDKTFICSKINQKMIELGMTARSTSINSHRSGSCSEWTLKRDGSLYHGPSGFEGMEFVSPVLEYRNFHDDVNAWKNQLKVILDILNDHRCIVNKSTGLHVHVSNSDLTFKQNKLIAKRYTKFEDVFDYFMPKSRRTNSGQYCGSLLHQAQGTPVTIINQMIDKICKARNIRALQSIFGRGNRYAKLNFTSNHPTVEFRHHSGTLDYEKITRWVEICHQIVVSAKFNKPIKKLDETRNGTRSLNHRFKVLVKPLDLMNHTENYFRKRMKKFIKEDGQPRTVQTEAR